MIKLIDILKEGLGYDSEGNVVFKEKNDYSDVLYVGNNSQTIKNVTVYYSFEYNPDRSGVEGKAFADKVKQLDGIDKETLKPAILDTIGSMIAETFMFKKVYYLDSSEPLSRLIAETIKEKYPEVEVLPLYKIKYPTWQDMLIPDYKTIIKSPDTLNLVEKTAEEMWVENEGKIKSSNWITKIRNYFKPKYDLQQLIDPDILFVDDNFQKGIDYNSIADHYPPHQQSRLLFYAAIKLPLSSKKSEYDIKKAKKEKEKLKSKIPANEIPGIKAIDIEDIKSFSNKAMLRSDRTNIGNYDGLIKNGYLEKQTVSLGGAAYYGFINKDITKQDVINAIEIKRLQELAGIKEIKVVNPASSFYLSTDPEYSTELELISDEEDEAYVGYTSNGDALDNGIFTFSTNISDEDVDMMSREEVFNAYAPKIFKQLRDEGAEWDADDEYIDVAISLDKLKKLFSVRSNTNEIKVKIHKYYAVFNIYGEHNKPPMYVIASSKEDMINQLNSAIKYFKSIETENPNKWSFKYDISDLDDETKIFWDGTVGDSYIWDDWAMVTDNVDTFNKHIDDYENYYGKEPEEYIG